MKFTEIMSQFDYNMSNIARALGISKAYVSIWKKKGELPMLRQCQLEVVTNGALKADKGEELAPP